MKVFDRIKVATTTEGTGDILIGSPLPGFLSFVAAGAVMGDQMPYVLIGGTQWESGLGTYNSDLQTMSRSEIYNSSNSNLIVDFVVGPKVLLVSANSGFLNSLIATVDAVGPQIAGKVDRTGDSMTGFLTLHANPSAGTHASTKSYVDTSISNAIASSGGPAVGVVRVVTEYTVGIGGETTFAVPGGFFEVTDVDVFVNGVRLPVTTYDATSLVDVVLTTGAVEDDVVSIVTHKPIAENAVVRKDGDVMTGFLTLHADPSAEMHAATKQYADGAAATAVANPPWLVRAIDYTAAAGENVIVDLNTGSRTLTLPPTPTPGDKVRIKWVQGTGVNVLTVGRNGSNIIGGALDYIAPEEDGSMDMVYANATIGWTL